MLELAVLHLRDRHHQGCLLMHLAPMFIMHQSRAIRAFRRVLEEVVLEVIPIVLLHLLRGRLELVSLLARQGTSLASVPARILLQPVLMLPR